MAIARLSFRAPRMTDVLVFFSVTCIVTTALELMVNTLPLR